MVYTEQDLYGNNILSYLMNEAVYVDNNILNPVTIPIIESNYGYHFLKFKDLDELCDNLGYSYDEALYEICNVNNIDDISVIIDEAVIIENPYIVNHFDSYVVNETSENSIEYRYCNSLLESYIDSGDESYLYQIIDESWVGDKIMQVHDWKKKAQNALIPSMLKHGPLKGYIKHREYQREQERNQKVNDLSKSHNELQDKYNQQQQTINNQSNMIQKQQGQLDALKKQLDYQSKSWISRKIGALRKLYANWLQKSREAVNANQANIFRQIATKIMGLIDLCLKKLQTATE